MRLSKGTLVVLGLCLVALAVMAIIDLATPVPPEVQLESLRDSMGELRVAADSCRTALTRERKALVASDARFDSLRARIDHYESLNPRGVPADSYQAYLKAFRSYNEGIPGRAAAGDTLAAHWEACRAIIKTHNQVADSARTLAREMGVWPDSSAEAPPGR